VAAIVPAYNEAAHIGDTIRSLQRQTTPPARIIVVDDYSTDGTGEVARSMNVTVLRPPSNTGTKAGAQNFALSVPKAVNTQFTMVIDADTTLAPDAIEQILPALADDAVAAACGYVVPRNVQSVWERGRYIEYLYAFSFHKQIQDYYQRPLISSGCFSVYRTDVLRAAGGWSTRTMAEDMDLTWTLYELGWKVRFVPEAVCYPVEPHDFNYMCKQLKRWSHGFIQNVRLHWLHILRLRYLFAAVMVGLFDAMLGALVYLVTLPLLSILVSPLFLLGYVIDAPVIIVPVVIAGKRRREVTKALGSVPAFFVLRLVNSYQLLKAAWLEVVLRRRLDVYEKGH
jgi:cellulose synthase/poly-beta-1,6-N-acetylglucosamine synthase-like glycosyltransferase